LPRPLPFPVSTRIHHPHTHTHHHHHPSTRACTRHHPPTHTHAHTPTHLPHDRCGAGRVPVGRRDARRGGSSGVSQRQHPGAAQAAPQVCHGHAVRWVGGHGRLWAAACAGRVCVVAPPGGTAPAASAPPSLAALR
jgi:hypothetical protein